MYENWQDTLVVTGPVATPLTLQIGDHLSGQIINGQGGGNFPTDVYEQLTVCISGVGVCYDNVINVATSGMVDQTAHGFLTVYAGETLTIENQLIAETNVGIPAGQFEGSSDFGETANSFFDVLTPGGGVLSASGVDYSTPTINAVPTPGTLLLVLAGAAALILVGRRTQFPRF